MCFLGYQNFIGASKTSWLLALLTTMKIHLISTPEAYKFVVLPIAETNCESKCVFHKFTLLPLPSVYTNRGQTSISFALVMVSKAKSLNCLRANFYQKRSAYRLILVLDINYYLVYPPSPLRGRDGRLFVHSGEVHV